VRRLASASSGISLAIPVLLGNNCHTAGA
jgi:hypothetical protein